MLKRLFQFSSNEDGGAHERSHHGGSPERGAGIAELATAVDRESWPAGAASGNNGSAAAGIVPFESFDQVYRTAAIKPPNLKYSILKIVEMLNSPHLAALSPEGKRCSLLMALEAAAVEIEDLLQDAVVRQRALNDFEESVQNKLKEFEATKSDENRHIQKELERISSECMARIQSNVDEVARAQDTFQAWQKKKHQESQRITEAATFCVPQSSGNNGLVAVLERATGTRGR